MKQKYRTEYLAKSGQSSSPYVQLLEAKRKNIGYKYQVIKNDKAPSRKISTAHPSVLSATKQNKSYSSQKVSVKQASMNKKQRLRTEQGQEKLHQSLCMPDNQPFKDQNYASKSLFYAIQPFQTSPQNKKLSSSHKRRKNSNKSSKNKQKQINEISIAQIFKEMKDLKISDIDSLISLIENCIQESTEYISYLTGKVQELKEQLTINLRSLEQRDNKLRVKNAEIDQKNQQIQQLKKDIQRFSLSDNKKLSNFQIKKLLEIVEKITEENNQLKHKIQLLTQQKECKDGKTRPKDLFNEIHGKIDILNIAIDQAERINSKAEPQKHHKLLKNKFF